MSMCALRETFERIAIEPSWNHVVSSSGHKLKHYGEQAVPMKLRDGRKIWITFQVCEVNGPIMSVGKSFVPRETIDAPRLRHLVVSCGTKKLERLWWTEFETTMSWNAGSNQETCWLRCELAAPMEVQVDLRKIVRQSHNEQMPRS